jgi:hypothetical protein
MIGSGRRIIGQGNQSFTCTYDALRASALGAPGHGGLQLQGTLDITHWLVHPTTVVHWPRGSTVVFTIKQDGPCEHHMANEKMGQ